MGKQGKAVEIGTNYQPFHNGTSTIFTVRPHTRDLTRPNHTTVWEYLTDYCKRKNISRVQVKTLARKRWLAVSSFRNRLYVAEICPDEIEDFLI